MPNAIGYQIETALIPKSAFLIPEFHQVIPIEEERRNLREFFRVVCTLQKPRIPMYWMPGGGNFDGQSENPVCIPFLAG